MEGFLARYWCTRQTLRNVKKVWLSGTSREISAVCGTLRTMVLLPGAARLLKAKEAWEKRGAKVVVKEVQATKRRDRPSLHRSARSHMP